MKACHEIDRVTIMDGDKEVANMTPEEAISLANGLLDSASHAIEKESLI